MKLRETVLPDISKVNGNGLREAAFCVAYCNWKKQPCVEDEKNLAVYLLSSANYSAEVPVMAFILDNRPTIWKCHATRVLGRIRAMAAHAAQQSEISGLSVFFPGRLGNGETYE